MISLLKVMCFRENKLRSRRLRGRELAKDEEEKAEAGEVEKEEGGKHQCEHCGKSYVFKHKLAHHKPRDQSEGDGSVAK